MSVIINPGTGPVDGATRENAETNMRKLLIDANADAAEVEFTKAWDDGRYRFVATLDGNRCEVDMPGWPLDRVRYIDREKQNIWHFPRLYVDGSSWVWCYAVGFVHDALHGVVEEDED